MKYGQIARVAGEAFDADQITPNCQECGRDEYSCDCPDDDEEEEPADAASSS